MLQIIIGLLVGFVILLISADYFIKSAMKISKMFNLSPLVVGVTIVAIGTSVPELVVSTIASVKGDTGLAFGNIIGSNIINILLVLAVGIIVGSVRIGSVKTQRSNLLMVVVTGLFGLLHLLNLPGITSAGILFLTAIGFSVLEYHWGIEGRSAEDAAFVNPKSQQMSSPEKILAILSLIGIIIGGMITVTSTESLAVYLNISTTLLGLSLTAIMTSFPELLISIFSEREGQDKIMIGNIIGSNIYNLTIIGGIIYLFDTKIAIKPLDWIFLIVSALIGLGIINIYKSKTVPKIIGVGLLILFGVYLLTLPA